MQRRYLSISSGELLWCSKCFRQPSLFSSLHQTRSFGISGGWGYNSFFGGGRQDHESNTRLLELPKTKAQSAQSVLLRRNRKQLNVAKWPSTVRTLGADYFFSEEREVPFTFYHMKLSNCEPREGRRPVEEGCYPAASCIFRLTDTAAQMNVAVDLQTGAPIFASSAMKEAPDGRPSPGALSQKTPRSSSQTTTPIPSPSNHQPTRASSELVLPEHVSPSSSTPDAQLQLHNNPAVDVCLIGHTDPSKVALGQNRCLTNCLEKTTRGFAAQLILEGRGVHAYFQPEFPNLFVRLGVGVKPMDCTRALLRFTGRTKVFLNKRGTVITVHGWNKRKTGTMAMYLYGIMRANAYTLKGAHIAFAPVRQKVPKKR